ncbi:MAG: HU family DNA-binding protein [Prevotella sp.]|nr:HU family DNA-binding protein [Prevotella sp.]
MSQKFTKLQNNNKKSTAYGKWFATAVYDQRFVETEELANYIQQQASVKKSDIKAVLDELGGAMKHYFELGQKVKLDGIGIFKVGFSSIGAADKVDCTAATITTRRVLFQPETERIVVGQNVNKEGKIVQKYVVAKTLIKDVFFEETYDPSLKPESDSTSSDDGGEDTTGDNTQGGGSSTGSGTGGGDNSSAMPGEGD